MEKELIFSLDMPCVIEVVTPKAQPGFEYRSGKIVLLGANKNLHAT